MQSFAGLVPSLVIVAGFIGLAVVAVRERSFALLTMLASVAFLAASFVGFLIDFPKQDGDNIKALYLLNAAVPLSVCGGWALSRVLQANRIAGLALLLLLGQAAYLSIRFLVLAAA
jgi:hypothetical protein